MAARKFLTAILLLVACSKPEPETPRDHDVPLRHPGGAGGRMDFSPPKGAPDEFWCEDDALPETKAGAGSACYRSKDECASLSEHLWTQYGNAGPVPACTKRRHAHCFDMDSRGTLYEVCRSTAKGCAVHHDQQTRDAWVHAITDSCEER